MSVTHYFISQIQSLVSIIGSVILIRRKLQLRSTDIKHGHDVLLEGITQNIQILGSIISAVINTCNADVVAIIIGTSIQDHVQRIDGESGAANDNGVGRGSRIAIDDVGTIVIAISGRGVEGGIDCVGDRGGIIVEGCAGVDL